VRRGGSTAHLDERCRADALQPVTHEKKNLNVRAYDCGMFPDIGKLDQAQYRPDPLVPADTKGGTRKLTAEIGISARQNAVRNRN